MALITLQAARCDGLWLSAHTDDRNRYYCGGCVRFCRNSPARRSCSLSRRSNYCWHFRGCCQLSFLLFHFFLLHFLPIVTGLCSAQKHFVLLIPLDTISFSLSAPSHAPQSVFRFSFVICRISIFRSASCQVQWDWLLIRKTQSNPM